MSDDFRAAVDRALSSAFHARADYEAYRRLLVDHDLVEATKDFQVEGNPKSSAYARLLDAITADAREHAFERKLDGFEYDLLLSAARSIPYDIMQAAQHPLSQRKLNFWSHERSPVSRMRRAEYPDLDSYGLNEATRRYLDLPFRTNVVERALIEVIVAERVFDMGRKAYGFRFAPLEPPIAPLRRWHPFAEWLYGILSLTVVVLGASLLMRAFSSWPGDGWSNAASIAFWVWLALAALALLNLPFMWANAVRERRAAEASLKPYLAFYSELGEQGVWSSRHLWEAAHNTSKVGAIWPANLYTLLDDRNGRGGRL